MLACRRSFSSCCRSSSCMPSRIESEDSDSMAELADGYSGKEGMAKDD